MAEVSAKAQPDPTALNPEDRHFDPKATKEKPVWYCVEVKFIKKFTNTITLNAIKVELGLEKMLLIKKGMRLSIQPVTKPEFKTILNLETR